MHNLVSLCRAACLLAVALKLSFGFSGAQAQTPAPFVPIDCKVSSLQPGDTCDNLLARARAGLPPGQDVTLQQLQDWNTGLDCADLVVGRILCLSKPVYGQPTTQTATPPAELANPEPLNPASTPAAVLTPTGTPAPGSTPTGVPSVTPQPTTLPGQAGTPLPTTPPGSPLPTTVLPGGSTSTPTPLPTPSTFTPPPTPTTLPATPTANPQLPTAAASAQPGPGAPSRACGTDFCCKMNILGSGAVGGIISAAIACVPSLQNPNPAATLEIYLGDALMARAADYTGVRPRPANEAGFLSPCAIFFVSNTPLSVTITDSSFTNIANSHTPLITFETGVNGVVINSNFQGNTGQLHGTIAVSSFMHIDVIGCQFIGNACSCGGAECGDSACHNAAVYVTEGATSNIVGCMFKDNVGHFGTGLLVTSGGSFSITGSSFINNRVDVSGSFGAAIAFNRCGRTSPDTGERAVTSTGSITGCIFDGNSVPGYGGAVAVDACSSITITGSSFTGNRAKMGGGALFLSQNGGAGKLDGSSTCAGNTSPRCTEVAISPSGFNTNGLICID